MAVCITCGESYVYRFDSVGPVDENWTNDPDQCSRCLWSENTTFTGCDPEDLRIRHEEQYGPRRMVRCSWCQGILMRDRDDLRFPIRCSCCPQTPEAEALLKELGYAPK